MLDWINEPFIHTDVLRDVICAGCSGLSPLVHGLGCEGLYWFRRAQRCDESLLVIFVYAVLFADQELLV